MPIRSTSADDAGELLALVHACDIAAVGFADFDPSEVEHALKAPFTMVAQEPSRPIEGWVFIDPAGDHRDWLDVYTHPEYGQAARRPLLALALERIRERGTQARAGAVPTETDWIAALEEAGFQFIKQHARMTIDLPVDVAPVAGVEVRPVRSDELRDFHRVLDTAFRDASDHNHRTYEQWLERWVDDQTVHWDEWLVAFVEGALAGVLQSKAGDEGWVQNLGVLREYRRRGVGRALLGQALRIYTAKGYSTAGLGVDLKNPTQAIKLYTSVGMTASYRANIYGLEPVGAAGSSA